MKIVQAGEVATEIEVFLIIQKDSHTYKWSLFMSESTSSDEWSMDGRLTPCPDWADELDMYELWEETNLPKPRLCGRIHD